MISDHEQLIRLDEAAGLFPAQCGRRVVYQTLIRWVIHGKKSVDGRQVRLEAVGNRPKLTSAEAVRRFLSALAGGPGAVEFGQAFRSPARSPAARHRNVAAVEAKADAIFGQVDSAIGSDHRRIGRAGSRLLGEGALGSK